MEMVTFPTDHATECDICMCQMKTESQCTLACCKKTLHKKCLLKWAVTKRSEFLTCPFCRSVILDIFSYISLSHVSQWLVDWNYNHSIVVKGKNVQIFIEEGFRGRATGPPRRDYVPFAHRARSRGPLPTDESSARESAQQSAPSAAFYDDTTGDDIEDNDTENDVESNTQHAIHTTSVPATNQVQQIASQGQGGGCDAGFWLILSMVIVIIVICIIIILCTGLL
jgi:hypothetical protein